MTPITDMLRRLFEKGADQEAILIAVEAAERAINVHLSTRHIGTTVDEAAERRRAWDRDRKRAQRSLRLSESEWLPLVASILKRDGHKCTYCGSTEKLTADHVVPLTRGGTNDESNLTACCIPCNSKKGNKLTSEWLPATSTVFHPNVHPTPVDAKNASNTSSITNNLSLDRVGERKPSVRGHRLPDDWTPSPEDWREATAKLGETGAVFELAKFRDYWKALPGAKGLKLDWNMTFRNWIRNAKVPNNGRRTVQDAARELHETLVARANIFDEPAPPSLRGGESSDAIRLLPPGRRQ